MSEPSTIFFFAALALGALFFVGFINQRQTRARIIAQKVVQLKRRVVEIEEMAASIEPLVESAGLCKTLLDEALELITVIAELDKSGQFCDAHRTNAQQSIEQIMTSANHDTLYRAQLSDAAIARTQYLINEAALITRKRQAAEKLELAEMEAFVNELTWANIMVVVITHIVEGHKAVNKGDVFKAYAFYKKAQQVLLQANTLDKRRHKMVKQLGEIMANKRKTLSSDVMPETQHNPSNDTKDLVPPPEEVREQMAAITQKAQQKPH